MNLLSGLLGRGKKGVMEAEWIAPLNESITSQLAVGYLDEESIVLGTSGGKIYALNASGKIKWKFSAGKSAAKEEFFFMENSGSGKLKSTSLIADIDKNGKGEVIFGSEDGILYALDCKGALLWKYKSKDSISGSAFAGDIDNDGKPEILFGSNDGTFYALNSSGKLLWTFSASSGIESEPAIISGKQAQIIFGSNDGTVYSLNQSGKKLWEFKTKGQITAQPSIADIFNDGRTLIIIGSSDSSIYALDDGGNIIWSYKTEGRIFSKAVLADINNDSKKEVIFGSCDDKVHILSSSGNKFWDYETNFWVVAAPLVGDFNDDKKMELAVSSYDHSLYILEAEGKYTMEYIPGIAGITGQSGHYTDLAISQPGSYSGNVLYEYRADGIITSQAALSDNGIVVSTDTGKLYKLRYKNL